MGLSNIESEPRHFSYSSMRVYENCPHKYRLSYIRGYWINKESTALRFGSAIHKALEAMYKGQDAKLALKKSIYEKPENVLWKKSNPDREYNLAVKMLEMYDKKKLHLIPRDVEKMFNIEVINPETNEKLPWTLKGKMDIVTKDGWICDHKTSSGSLTQTWADNEFQATAYSFAYKNLYKETEKGIIYNVLIKRVKEPRLEAIVTRRDLSDKIYFFEVAKDFIGKVRMGIFPKNKGRHCKYCQYSHICL